MMNDVICNFYFEIYSTFRLFLLPSYYFLQEMWSH